MANLAVTTNGPSSISIAVPVVAAVTEADVVADKAEEEEELRSGLGLVFVPKTASSSSTSISSSTIGPVRGADMCLESGTAILRSVAVDMAFQTFSRPWSRPRTWGPA